MSTNVITPRAGRREWIGLAVLALPCLLYSMDLTVLHLAVPAISAELEPTSAELLWIIDIYGFLVAGMLVPMGAIGDRIGRRRLLLIGAAIFGLTSLLAAFSTSPGMLIASRALLGLAGATIAPSTLSLIRNLFHDPRQRTIAVGWWISSYSAGAAIGPLVGGIALELFWWGSVFLLALPVMVLLLALGPVLLPEYRDPEAGKPDLLSAALSLNAILAIIFGVKQFAQDGLGWQPMGAILAGLVLGGIFIHRQSRLADPLVDLELFRIPAFTAALGIYASSALIMSGGFLFLSQYLQLVLGLSPLTAGLWTVPWAIAFVVGANITPRLAVRIRPGVLMAAGLALAAAGLALFTQLGTTPQLMLFQIASIAMGLGLTPVITLTTDIVIGTAPPERTGAASGISETAAELAMAVGIAIYGSIGVAVYRGALSRLLPAELPAEAVAAARDTLGNAIDVASVLPEPLGAALIEAARLAFIDGLHLSAAISTAAALGLAALVVTLLWNVQPPAGPEEEAEAEAEIEAEVRTTLAS